MLEIMWQDCRQAVRSLRRTAGVSLAAIAVLALGIGANMAIFTVVDAAILQPLPYPDPERLVVLWGNVQRQRVERRGNSWPDYIDWKAQAASFEGMAAVTDTNYIVRAGDEAERVPGEFVSAEYFGLLGVRPVMGRSFTKEEDSPSAQNAVAVIGEGLWKRSFGADPGISGRKVQINDRVFTIVGVMPAGFRGVTDQADIWAPFTISGYSLDQRGSRGFVAIARLKPGVSRRQAQTEMDGISKRLEKEYPDTNEKRGVDVASLAVEATGDLRTPLLILLGAVGLVLLIACSNVTNLLLARSETRSGEIAVRVALGAGRMRLLRQFICEGLVLSLTGAIGGLLLAWWAVQALIAASPIRLPSFVQPGLDWRVALFSILLSLAVGVFVGIVPALQSGRGNPADVLKATGARAGASLTRQRLRSAMVVSQIALATILLIGAGLLMSSFRNASRIDPGFEPVGLLTMNVTLPRILANTPANTPASAATSAFVTGRQLIERVGAAPGVRAVSIGSDTPLRGANAIFYTAEGQPVTGAVNLPRAYVHRIWPGFFSTLGARFTAGREFTAGEISSSAQVVIVTDRLTNRFWPGQDPIGKRIKLTRAQSEGPWHTIVGVVREMKYRGVPENPTADADIFLPFSENQRSFALLVRASGPAASVTSAVREAIRQTDATATVLNVETMEERIGSALERSRFAGWAMTVFAALALLLTSVGLYALVSYTVARRTREIGVRIAMGAKRWAVVSLILSRGMTLVSAGVVIGIAGALAATRVLRAVLFNVSATDLTTFVSVPLVLAMVALIACYLPARRAAALDPVAALRQE